MDVSIAVECTRWSFDEISPSHWPPDQLDTDSILNFLIHRWSLKHVGKVDEKGFPKPAQATWSSSEKVVRQFVSEVLSCPEIDVNWSLFKLGGHSPFEQWNWLPVSKIGLEWRSLSPLSFALDRYWTSLIISKPLWTPAKIKKELFISRTNNIIDFDSEVCDQLRDLASKEGCTFHTVLKTLFERLLTPSSDDISDITLGSIMSIRTNSPTDLQCQSSDIRSKNG